MRTLFVYIGIITLQHLSNNLPITDQLSNIVEMLFDVLMSETLPLPLIARCLSTLESLTDHDYGMQFLKKFIIEKGEKNNNFNNLQTII